jgi:small-conductance mechanosensitive channel
MNVDDVHKDWSLLEFEWRTVIVPLGVFLLCVAGGFLVRNLLFRWVRRWPAAQGRDLNTIIVHTLRAPIIIWAVIWGFDLATRSSELPKKYSEPINVTLEALWIISITIIAAQLSGNLVRTYSARSEGTNKAPTLTKTLTEILVAVLGLLFFLNYLKVDIRPLLTALGVGGLAVALALQDTLANLFAGLYISVSSQIRVGDYVKLSTGEEGYVTDITWRSTTLRALANNYIFIPNSKLAQANITNYNLPTKSLGMSINIHAAFDADTDQIEKLLVEEAMKEKIDGLITDPKPYVQWSTTGDSSLLLTLNFEVAEFANQYNVQSELRRRIFKRFRKEGIALPYPTQTVVTKPYPTE